MRREEEECVSGDCGEIQVAETTAENHENASTTHTEREGGGREREGEGGRGREKREEGWTIKDKGCQRSVDLLLDMKQTCTA